MVERLRHCDSAGAVLLLFAPSCSVLEVSGRTPCSGPIGRTCSAICV